jgi:hypothetical protein
MISISRAYLQGVFMGTILGSSWTYNCMCVYRSNYGAIRETKETRQTRQTKQPE